MKVEFVFFLGGGLLGPWSGTWDPGRGKQALEGTLGPGWEYGDPNSCASPGNGKPMYSGPLYNKNDTLLFLVITNLEGRNKLRSNAKVALTTKRICLSSTHLKSSWYAYFQNAAENSVRKQITKLLLPYPIDVWCLYPIDI